MKKIALLVAVMMVILSTTTAFAYGVRGTSQLTMGVCLEMDDGTQIISLMVNDEENHVIYFRGSDASDFVSMQVEVDGGTVVYEDTIFSNEDVMSWNIWYVCYCIEQGWL